MRFMFTCGGTGGHINPAIAVAKLVREKRPNAEILFVGVNGGMETRLVPAAGFRIETIEAEGISRKMSFRGAAQNIRAFKKMITSKHSAGEIIDRFRPDVVLGTGGYACFPILRTAARKGIPTLIHESNAFPGLATRTLAGDVSRILVNFETSREYFKDKERVRVVGNPIRGDLLMYNREKARAELKMDARPLLVSFWGSLGAREMNKQIAQFIKFEAEDRGKMRHIHATGKFGFEWMPDYIKSMGVELAGQSDIILREYIDDMPRVLAAADLVMCRGGAGTLSELAAVGKPSIIIPSPNVTDNHQLKNAQELAAVGGAIVIEESECTPELLYKTVSELLSNSARRLQMSKSLAKIAILDGADRIYDEIIKITR